MCLKAGRKVALIDEFGLFDLNHPAKIDINPFGGILDAHQKMDHDGVFSDRGELVFATDAANHALIEEPSNDERNAYFRYEPRAMLEYAELSLLANTRGGCTPGGVWQLLSDPEQLDMAIKIDLEEGHPNLKSLAAHMQAMAQNPEHYGQHLGAVKKALKVFSAGSPLHFAGSNPDISHKQLLEEGYITFIVGPQEHMDRLGSYFALHLQSFMQALLCGPRRPANPGAFDASNDQLHSIDPNQKIKVDFLLDEFTNALLKEIVSSIIVETIN